MDFLREKFTNGLFSFHHVGVAVPSIEASYRDFQLFSEERDTPEIFSISSQQVNVCFIKAAGTGYVELVEPAGPQSAIHGILQRRASYYHLRYLTGHFEEAIRTLQSRQFRCLDIFSSEAFRRSQCAFLMAPGLQLLEIIEHLHAH